MKGQWKFIWINLDKFGIYLLLILTVMVFKVLNIIKGIKLKNIQDATVTYSQSKT